MYYNIDPPGGSAGESQEEETYVDQNIPVLFPKPSLEMLLHGYPYSEPEYEELEYKEMEDRYR
jgi:hypothetical protein